MSETEKIETRLRDMAVVVAADALLAEDAPLLDGMREAARAVRQANSVEGAMKAAACLAVLAEDVKEAASALHKIADGAVKRAVLDSGIGELRTELPDRFITVSEGSGRRRHVVKDETKLPLAAFGDPQVDMKAVIALHDEGKLPEGAVVVEHGAPVVSIRTTARKPARKPVRSDAA